MSIHTGVGTHKDDILFTFDRESKKCVPGEATTNIAGVPEINPTYSTEGTYQPGWDTALHADAVTVNNWGTGYNGGVTRPATDWHAHWVYEDDTRTGVVMKYVDQKGTDGFYPSWLGTHRPLGAPSSYGIGTNTTITVSADAKVTDVGKPCRMGLYHRRVAEGTNGFESNIADMYLTEANKWERVSFTSTTTTNWNLGIGFSLYTYGHIGSTDAILYVKNWQIELKDHATPYTPDTRTLEINNVDGNDSFTYNSLSYDTDGLITFDGVDDRIQYAGSNYPAVWSDAVTVEVWMRVPTGATWGDATYLQGILARGGYAGSIGLARDTSEGNLQMRARHDGASVSAYATGLSRDVFHHVVGTWNGSTVSVYINGDLIDTSASTVTSGVPDNGDWVLGGNIAFGGASGGHSEGDYALGRVYKKELTAAQIQQNFAANRKRFGV